MRLTIQGSPCAPAEAWALVGDTDHLHRLSGDPPLEMSIETDAHGYPEVLGTIIGPGPVRHGFVEKEVEWVRGRTFRNVRTLRGPLLRSATYEATLEPGGDGGVTPSITVDMEASHGWLRPLVNPLVRRLARRWEAALRSLPSPGSDAKPPVRKLPRDVSVALDRWRAATSSPAVSDHLASWLTTAHARELREIRPHVLASEWKLGRREVLCAFLDATEAGALELYWSVRCPRCHATVSAAETLSNLADHAECDSCRIDFGPDLEQSVEVVFAAHRSIRPKPAERFCTLFPAGRPDVLALLTMAPGEERTLELTFPPGRWYLGPGGDVRDVEILAGDSGPSAIEIRLGEASTDATLAAGPVRITLVNASSGRARVQLAGLQETAAPVSAAYLATMPEYRRRFGSQVLAPDVRVGVQAMAFLFTDLVGSAAMYEELGDAAAFGLVHEQFGVLEEIVERYGGVRVKTIGDALMGAFHRPAAAAGAAIAMLEHFESWAAGKGLDTPPALRVGVHHGPALAVHSDHAGLDYFGGSVNLAARAEGLAAAGEAVLTAAVHDDPQVEELLGTMNVTVEPFDSAIKGLPQELRFHRVRPQRGPS